MKKLLSLVLLTGVALGSQAQDKKFQLGLMMGTTVNWTKIQTTHLEKNGLGKDFTIGVGGNYLFNENIGLAFGVQFDMGNFKLNYGSDASVNLGDVFYAYHDTEIKMFKDGAVEDAVDTAAFQLLSRTYRTKYITVPFFLKFQTSLIGQFKYYGKFGLRTSFLGSVRMDDLGRDANYDPVSKSFTTLAPISERTMENMKPDGFKKELSIVKTAIGVYAGAEWNFTGNTFLYLEAGFNYGIIPQLYSKSSTLVDKVETTPGSYTYSNLEIDNNPQHMMEIKVGLLF